jgi:hypothetical protein
VLTRLEGFPELTPLAIAAVDDAVYVAGVSYPGRQFDPNAPDIGRLLRVPFDGSAVREVWRGPYFSQMRAFGARIVLVETDPSTVLWDREADGSKTYGGLHLYDTRTHELVEIPNAPGRDAVVDFQIGEHGVYWTAFSLLRVDEKGARSGKPGYTMARWTETGGTQTLSESTEISAAYFRRGDDVLATLPHAPLAGASGGQVAYSALAVHRIQASGFELERVLDDLGRSAPGLPSYRVLGADAATYYLSESLDGDTHRLARVPKLDARAGVTPPLTSWSFGPPVLAGGEVLWVSAAEHSMIRKRSLSSDDAPTTGAEVVSDTRREITSLAADDCNVYWVSRSLYEESEPFRIAARAR